MIANNKYYCKQNLNYLLIIADSQEHKMRFNKILLTLTMVLGLAACTNVSSLNDVTALNNTQAVGSPFTRQLTEEYRTFANFQLNQDKDYEDAIHFARKGVAAATGQIVMPEPLDDWDLTTSQTIELGDARARLIHVFEMGSIAQLPELSAVAQARFDCWVEAEEEVLDNPNPYIIPCKSQFFDALAQLEARTQQLAPPMPPVAAAPAFPAPIEPVDNYSDQPVALADAVYLVFFDFDKSLITSGAQDVINTVSGEINSRNLNGINIVGHTDSSGSDAYNRALGMRRANAVRTALVKLGVPANMITTSSKGEAELLVPTGDNVKEPANRRATITFE
tara:strand:+ start:1259 stop:2266 length:1008 start_codon:yes stop_codon:yes gene_type:complete